MEPARLQIGKKEMKMVNDFRGNREQLPRLAIELRDDQLKIRNIFEFGQMRAVFSVIVDELIELHESYGPMAIAAIQAGDVSIIDMLKKKRDS